MYVYWAVILKCYSSGTAGGEPPGVPVVGLGLSALEV